LGVNKDTEKRRKEKDFRFIDLKIKRGQIAESIVVARKMRTI